ncbi:jg1641 [Pararge aegeria aegeria]|uniref:Jg1641 protein n=1 Tax=Pararge aegeria aegeria TaxID=348720 RepID=A0A8S4RGC7_9NEOP|nr:jg1641 [Pararge aegeria aegeria]
MHTRLGRDNSSFDALCQSTSLYHCYPACVLCVIFVFKIIHSSYDVVNNVVGVRACIDVRASVACACACTRATRRKLPANAIRIQIRRRRSRKIALLRSK